MLQPFRHQRAAQTGHALNGRSGESLGLATRQTKGDTLPVFETNHSNVRFPVFHSKLKSLILGSHLLVRVQIISENRRFPSRFKRSDRGPNTSPPPFSPWWQSAQAFPKATLPFIRSPGKSNADWYRAKISDRASTLGSTSNERATTSASGC